MLAESFNGDKERSVLASVVYDDSVLASVVEMQRQSPFLFKTDLANEVLRWAVNYYEKYNKAPGEDIMLLPAEYSENNRDYAIKLDSLVHSLQKPASLNSARLLDKATAYFDVVHIDQLADSLKVKLTRNDVDGCIDSINKFSRITSGITSGVNPLQDDAALTAAFADNTTTSLINFKSEDSKAFFGDTFSRASFVVVNASEKAGKCIEGTQRVLCGDGVYRSISEIVAKNKPIEVYAVDLDTGFLVQVTSSKFYNNGVKECYKVSTESGKELICTGNHPLFVNPVSSSPVWCPVLNIPVGSLIRVCDGFHTGWDKITSIEKVGERAVYDIEVPGFHNFIVESVVVHNSSFLLEMALTAVFQGRKVAYFEAGDMSQAQVFRRIYQRLARHPRRAGDIKVPVSFSVTDDDYGKDVQIDVQFEDKHFDEDMSIDIARSARDLWIQRGGGTNWKFSAHPQDLTVPKLTTILDEWERAEGFIPDFIVIDYADLIQTISKNNEFRHQINDTFSRLRGVSLDRKCCLLTATQANAGGWSTKVMTRENLAEDKRKAAHPTAILGLSASAYERQRQVAKLNYIVRRDDMCNEYAFLYMAQCLATCQPMIKTCYPVYRKRCSIPNADQKDTLPAPKRATAEELQKQSEILSILSDYSDPSFNE